MKRTTIFLSADGSMSIARKEKRALFLSRSLERKYGFFKVYETGWCKADTFVKERAHTPHNARPVVLYSSTFTKNITSAPHLFDTIKRLVREKNWDWIISFHPKFSDMEVLKKYKELAASCPNITFHEGGLVDAKPAEQCGCAVVRCFVCDC